MEIITLTKENPEKEHICCAVSNGGDCQVTSKKAWLSDRFDDGLVFKKGNVRGEMLYRIYPRGKGVGPPSTRPNICTSTAFGWRDSIKDRETAGCFCSNVSRTVNEREKRDWSFFHRRKNNPFFPIPNF